jgi:hypothetical protein
MSNPAFPTRRGKNVTELNAPYPISGPSPLRRSRRIARLRPAAPRRSRAGRAHGRRGAKNPRGQIFSGAIPGGTAAHDRIRPPQMARAPENLARRFRNLLKHPGRFGGIFGVRELAASFPRRSLLRRGDSTSGYYRLAKRRRTAALHSARNLISGAYSKTPACASKHPRRLRGGNPPCWWNFQRHARRRRRFSRPPGG